MVHVLLLFCRRGFRRMLMSHSGVALRKRERAHKKKQPKNLQWHEELFSFLRFEELSGERKTGLDSQRSGQANAQNGRLRSSATFRQREAGRDWPQGIVGRCLA